MTGPPARIMLEVFVGRAFESDVSKNVICEESSMKKAIKPTGPMLFCAVFAFFLFHPNAFAIENGLMGKSTVINYLPPGTIIPTTLPPKIFLKRAQENIWTLANGDEAPKGSKYRRILKKNGMDIHLPDLRGMFLRGAGRNSDKSYHYKGDYSRKGGDKQLDALKKHKHPQPRDVHDTGGRIAVKAARPRTNYGYGMQPPHETEENDGEDETRPKNIAVYYYIKIN